jgi:hypothetical protein
MTPTVTAPRVQKPEITRDRTEMGYGEAIKVRGLVGHKDEPAGSFMDCL